MRCRWLAVLLLPPIVQLFRQVLPCWQVPLLDNNGKFNGQYELRLMVALDVGGAIKGQHFDIYQGIGPEAGHRAGWYNHYGRVWVLKTAPGAGNVFSG